VAGPVVSMAGVPHACSVDQLGDMV
jgi:hypothetical protein